jgi:hypothetical protein
MRNTPPPSYHEALNIASVPRAMVNDEVTAKLVGMGFTTRSRKIRGTHARLPARFRLL